VEAVGKNCHLSNFLYLYLKPFFPSWDSGVFCPRSATLN
jgi:hypothetical protein